MEIRIKTTTLHRNRWGRSESQRNHDQMSRWPRWKWQFVISVRDLSLNNTNEREEELTMRIEVPNRVP
jgi:hypothetical protein